MISPSRLVVIVLITIFGTLVLVVALTRLLPSWIDFLPGGNQAIQEKAVYEAERAVKVRETKRAKEAVEALSTVRREAEEELEEVAADTAGSESAVQDSEEKLQEVESEAESLAPTLTQEQAETIDRIISGCRDANVSLLGRVDAQANELAAAHRLIRTLRAENSALREQVEAEKVLRSHAEERVNQLTRRRFRLIPVAYAGLNPVDAVHQRLTPHVGIGIGVTWW